jgi:hypothetical protein
MRKDRLRYAQNAKQVRLELLSQIFQSQILYHGHVTDSRIVNQHIDRSGLLQNGLHRILYRRIVANIYDTVSSGSFLSAAK